MFYRFSRSNQHRSVQGQGCDENLKNKKSFFHYCIALSGPIEHQIYYGALQKISASKT